MPDIKYLKKLEDMDTHTEVVDSDERDHVAVLLSEPATRELCLALDEYQNQISPYKPEIQESVGGLYDIILTRFKFGRGSYVLSTDKIPRLDGERLRSYSPEDPDVWRDLRETFTEAFD